MQLQRLIDDRGRNGKIIDWLDELTVDCPKKIALNMNDPCGVKSAIAEGAVRHGP
jgi:hypothetical protein